MYIAILLLAGGAALFWWFSIRSPTTISPGMERPGGSGIPEQIFFAIFGAPRDTEKEAGVLSERRAPVVPTQFPNQRTGFMGRGANGRW